MTKAIVLIAIIGMLDTMLYLGCTELEKKYVIKEKDNERSNSKADK